MSFPRYPSYKVSGVKWLESMPEHWVVVRLKNVLSQRITDGPHTTPLFTNEGLPFLSVDAIQGGELRFNGCRYVSEEDHADFCRKAKPRRGDLLMGKAASTGKIARVKVDFEFSIWSPLALIRLNQDACDPSFAEFALKSPMVQAQIENFCTFNTQRNISMDDIPRLVLMLPPLAEQLHVAAFLERETAKIDDLVAEQRRLMELLKEKRQAVISHAVTKGLNPRASMKPSGIEWLGDVPAHWQVLPTKYLARVGNGSTPNRENPAYWSDGEYPWLTSTVVNADCVLEAEEFVTSLALTECHLPKISPPAVLIGITGQGRTRGMATTLLVEATINQHIAFVKPLSSRVDVFFLRRFFDMVHPFLRRDSDTGGSTKGAITCDQIGNVKLALPPPEEQAEIILYTKAMTLEYDALTSEAQRAIDLLQERRTALISASVTGQIDVRHLSQGNAA